MKLMKWIVGLSVLFLATQVFSQGSLTPPGAPGATMKTLDQVEARTPIGSSTTISQSGSYYLTGNVTNGGITVTADNVTLDLNGFSVVGSSGNGIEVVGAQNVVVRNGSVQGFDVCVMVSGASVCRFEKLVVSESDTIGFYFNGAGGACNGNVVEACTLIGNGERGIHFIGNVGECSFNQVKDCLIGNNNGDGIYFEGQSSGNCNENRVVDTLIAGNSDRGILFNGSGGNCSGNEIVGCQITGNLYGGISMGAGCGNNRIVNNTIVDNSGSTAGLAVLAGGNFISGNIVEGNTTNYDFSTGNQLNLLISEIPETLDWPCAVKLSGTLTCTLSGTNGITVAANDVTIDMAGHTLIGPGSNSGSGIYQDSAYRNLRVFNGKAVHWEGSNQSGIRAFGDSAILSNLQVSTNYAGIVVGGGGSISDCTAYKNGDDGIIAAECSTLSGCTASDNGGRGIEAGSGSSVRGCSAYENGKTGLVASSGSTITGCSAGHNLGDGMQVGYGSTITECAAFNNGDDGFYVLSDCNVYGCTARANIGDGIETQSDCRISDCICNNNGNAGGDGAGIYAHYINHRIDGNTVTGNDRGIEVGLSGNLIVRNFASDNTVNYDIAPSNSVGTIQTTPVGAGAWDNFSF